MNAHNEQQGYTAADMADQAAAAFERGRESVLANPCRCIDCGGVELAHSDDCTNMAELHGTPAAPEVVAWTVVGPDGKSSVGGWQDMKTHDFWREAGVLREGHRYAYAYAAPVAAAPEGFVMVPVAPTEDMLMFMGGHDDAAARRAYALMLAASPQGASDERE